MLPIKWIIFDKIDKINWKIDNIDFSQQICLSIFIDFRYNQLILSIAIECCRLSILSIAQVGV